MRRIKFRQIVAAIGLVVAIAGFFLWKATSVKTYTGPPIDMGAAMKAGGGQPGGAGK